MGRWAKEAEFCTSISLPKFTSAVKNARSFPFLGCDCQPACRSSVSLCFTDASLSQNMQKSVSGFSLHIPSSLKIRFSDPRLTALGIVNRAYGVGSYQEHFPANSSHDLLISIIVLLPVSSSLSSLLWPNWSLTEKHEADNKRCRSCLQKKIMHITPTSFPLSKPRKEKEIAKLLKITDHIMKHVTCKAFSKA